MRAICERLAVASRRARANKLLPIRTTLLVNRGEKFARHRYGYRFNANDLLDLVRRHGGFRSLQPARSAKPKKTDNKSRRIRFM